MSSAPCLLHELKQKVAKIKDKCFFSLRPTLMKTNADSFTNKVELYLRRNLKRRIFTSPFFVLPPTPVNKFSLKRFSSIPSSYVVVVVWLIYLFPIVIFRITRQIVLEAWNEAVTKYIFINLLQVIDNYPKNSFARAFEGGVQVDFYTPARLLAISWKTSVVFFLVFKIIFKMKS